MTAEKPKVGGAMELKWQEGKLSRLEWQWRELRQAEGLAQPRALALNLICRAHDAADGARMAAQLWELGSRHPARVFLITPGEGTAQVRVAAQAAGSEMVELRGAPELAASLVAPLLACDLPALLLWRGSDPTGNGEFMGWAALAERVLVDAHRLGLPAAKLAALAQQLPANATIGDLTWTRLTPWRHLLCQGLEGGLAKPAGIEAVTIAAGGIGDHADSGGSLAATMFAGWMAQKLQWQPGQRTSEGLRLNRPLGPPVLLRFEPASVHECLLKRVRLEGGSPQEAITIEHRGPHVAVTITQGSSVVGEWMGTSAGETLLRGEAATLSEELAIHQKDHLFLQALERGLALMAGWEAAAA
ncbi:MAG: glucose-6-phosphate dehydrogenase assembly protein OpcA [Terriglobales bacterium]